MMLSGFEAARIPVSPIIRLKIGSPAQKIDRLNAEVRDGLNRVCDYLDDMGLWGSDDAFDTPTDSPEEQDGIRAVIVEAKKEAERDRATTDDRVLDILRWNIRRLTHVNTDPKHLGKFVEAEKLSLLGLEAAVEQGRLSPRFAKAYMRAGARVKIRYWDALGTIREHGVSRRYHERDEIFLPEDFKLDRYVHERTHAAGGFRDASLNEAVTTMISHAIVRRVPGAKCEAWMYQDERDYVMPDLKESRTSLHEVSRLFAGRRHTRGDVRRQRRFMRRLHGRPDYWM